MMNNSGPAVAVSGLQVVRGKRRVIPGLDLEIPGGQVIGLLGPSGSGKSTLMRCIVGVQVIESGTVTVLGHPAGSPVLRDRVGYVTQSPSVYADLSVRDNVVYFGRAIGLRGAELREAVDRTLAEVDLESYAEQLVQDLSGGQESRVSLAAALVGRPSLLVLDEPTVGLDPVIREELWATFHSIAQRGAAVLVSSHVMDEAERCDRLLLMRDGLLIADGTPAAIKQEAGADDVEGAFLALVRRDDRGAAS